MFTSGKTCTTCGRPKPEHRFYSKIDSSCKVCRKLIKTGIILSKRTTISQASLFKGINPYRCVTCGNFHPWENFLPNSYECLDCTALRHKIEYYQCVRKKLKIVCLVCEKPKDVQHFPNGDMICKTCIYKTNKYKGGMRYE